MFLYSVSVCAQKIFTLSLKPSSVTRTRIVWQSGGASALKRLGHLSSLFCLAVFAEGRGTSLEEASSCRFLVSQLEQLRKTAFRYQKLFSEGTSQTLSAVKHEPVPRGCFNPVSALTEWFFSLPTHPQSRGRQHQHWQSLADSRRKRQAAALIPCTLASLHLLVELLCKLLLSKKGFPPSCPFASQSMWLPVSGSILESVWWHFPFVSVPTVSSGAILEGGGTPPFWVTLPKEFLRF